MLCELPFEELRGQMERATGLMQTAAYSVMAMSWFITGFT